MQGQATRGGKGSLDPPSGQGLDKKRAVQPGLDSQDAKNQSALKPACLFHSNFWCCLCLPHCPSPLSPSLVTSVLVSLSVCKHRRVSESVRDGLSVPKSVTCRITLRCLPNTAPQTWPPMGPSLRSVSASGKHTCLGLSLQALWLRGMPLHRYASQGHERSQVFPGPPSWPDLN